jgi:hypothetical protein
MSDSLFNFTRNYPFDEETKFNVVISTSENWSEQRRLKSASPRKNFTVNFYPATKTEVDAIKAFFVARSGPYEDFKFDNPLDNLRYSVRFVDDSIKVSRVAYNTYKVSLQLQTLNAITTLSLFVYGGITVTESVTGQVA